MKRKHLHEVAKFAAGLVAGDFISLVWLANNSVLPVSFLGMNFTPDMVLPGLVFDASIFIILVHYGWNIGKAPLMRERTFLVIAGAVFGIVALAHLTRVFTGAELDVFSWMVPLWLSWVGTVVTAYLSYMSFHLAASTR